jgi:D-serine deaminase-like pyridoxal phosphate-dependent protein
MQRDQLISPETPFAVLDMARFESNLARGKAFAEELGVSQRPHCKTHKIPKLAQIQQKYGAQGITLATIGEAEVFVENGLLDVFIAYPIWPTVTKKARLAKLAEKAKIRIGVDSHEAIQGWMGLASVGVMVEINSGHNRSGCNPRQAGELAEAIVKAGLRFDGVFTYPGHSYHPDKREKASLDEAEALRIALDSVATVGLEAKIVSGGSTPSWRTTSNLLTEMRQGVYPFNDAQQIELGNCGFEDVSFWIVATVVSKSGQKVVLDAGSKALGADKAAWASGYGRLLDFPDAVLTALSEHHVTAILPDGAEAPELGTQLRVLPNHVCNAFNLQDIVFPMRDSELGEPMEVLARSKNN